DQLGAFPRIVENAIAVGYQHLRPVPAEELYALEPHLGPGAVGALEVPHESIICPFTTPLAFATEAVVNGVTLALESPVDEILTETNGVHALTTPRGVLHSRYVVNAAGLHADTIDRWFGYATFRVVPRRGELIVFDKLARPLLTHILL